MQYEICNLSRIFITVRNAYPFVSNNYELVPNFISLASIFEDWNPKVWSKFDGQKWSYKGAKFVDIVKVNVFITQPLFGLNSWIFCDETDDQCLEVIYLKILLGNFNILWRFKLLPGKFLTGKNMVKCLKTCLIFLVMRWPVKLWLPFHKFSAGQKFFVSNFLTFFTQLMKVVIDII